MCKAPSFGITRNTDHFACGPLVDAHDLSDNGIDTMIQSDDEKELAIIAGIEAKQLSLGKKSELKTLKNGNNDEFLESMHGSGVVRINNLLPQEIAPRLVDFIRKELKESIRDVEDGKVQPLERFSNMLSSANRWDFKLSLDNPMVMATMKSMFQIDGPLGQLMTSLVSGDGELFELAAFCTSSGAGRQVVHADTLWSKQPALYTCALALQDITEDMGPTLFIPGKYIQLINQLMSFSSYEYSLVTLLFVSLRAHTTIIDSARHRNQTKFSYLLYEENFGYRFDKS